MTGTAGRLRVFTYVTADKATLYRAVMRVFVDAKTRFTLHLRPEEVAAALASANLPEPADAASVEAALAQLREWGNLEAHPDTADVATVEEFYRPRYLFQLTREGEAAERALAVYEEALRQRGELQSAALSDIRVLLGELAAIAEMADPDEAKAHRTLRTLHERFEGDAHRLPGALHQRAGRRHGRHRRSGPAGRGAGGRPAPRDRGPARPGGRAGADAG